MDLLAIVGLICVIYYLFYLIYPCFLDCDIKLALTEKFGKPVESLRGKVVWITGASSGIGEHLAYVLADAGCKLVLTARREGELQRVKKNCVTGSKYLSESDVEIIPFDICDFDVHEKYFNRVIEKFGQLDILVNNAGCSQRAEWEEIEVAVDKDMFNLNVLSVMSLTRIVVKYFQKKNSGHIVINSSLAGTITPPFSATYCGTKHALHGYFNAFRIEKIEKNIPVTLICPGPIQTDFLAKSFTARQGEKYGVATEVSSSKISTGRCATLMAIAIANELQEVWICKSVLLQITYLLKYYPNVGNWIIMKLGPKFLQHLRDAKVSNKK